MKCDELKVRPYTILSSGQCYDKDEVDEAIAELKEKLHDVDNQWNEQCKEIAMLKAKLVGLQSFYDLHGNVDNYIDRLKSEKESLKTRLENAMATVAFNHLDAVTSEQRLKRALWLARALRARDIQRWWISATCAPGTERACRIWNNVERKCRAKAEEYK